MEEKKNIWWKVYFYFVVTLLFLVGLGLLLIEDEFYRFYDTSDLIYDIFLMFFAIVSLVGLWGFIYKKYLFYREFWIIILIMSIVTDFGESLETYSTDKYGILISILLSIPLYIALYIYTIKQKEKWEN